MQYGDLREFDLPFIIMGLKENHTIPDSLFMREGSHEVVNVALVLCVTGEYFRTWSCVPGYYFFKYRSLIIFFSSFGDMGILQFILPDTELN